MRKHNHSIWKHLIGFIICIVFCLCSYNARADEMEPEGTVYVITDGSKYQTEKAETIMNTSEWICLGHLRFNGLTGCGDETIIPMYISYERPIIFTYELVGNYVNVPEEEWYMVNSNQKQVDDKSIWVR